MYTNAMVNCPLGKGEVVSSILTGSTRVRRLDLGQCRLSGERVYATAFRPRATRKASPDETFPERDRAFCRLGNHRAGLGANALRLGRSRRHRQSAQPAGTGPSFRRRRSPARGLWAARLSAAGVSAAGIRAGGLSAARLWLSAPRIWPLLWGLSLRVLRL